MKVCIYAIMRDEVHNAAEWAVTTYGADERFVLDTGSTDGTDTTLSAAGINVRGATFIPFRFDDARNAALALAPAADLYFRLDADERLEPGWREQLDDVFHPNMPRYRLTVVNHGSGWAEHTRDDLHQRPGFRWKYPTHEVLVGPVTTVMTPIIVHHHPTIDRRPHHNANLDVLREATVEYPNDHRMAFYYARELWYSGQWERCRTAMTYFLSLPNGWPAERAEAYRILAAIDFEPERWLWRAVGECPERREPWVDLARLHLQQGDGHTARAMIEMAAKREDRTIYTTDQSAWDEGFRALADELFAINPTAGVAELAGRDL